MPPCAGARAALCAAAGQPAEGHLRLQGRRVRVGAQEGEDGQPPQVQPLTPVVAGSAVLVAAVCGLSVENTCFSVAPVDTELQGCKLALRSDVRDTQKAIINTQGLKRRQAGATARDPMWVGRLHGVASFHTLGCVLSRVPFCITQVRNRSSALAVPSQQQSCSAQSSDHMRQQTWSLCCEPAGIKPTRSFDICTSSCCISAS